MQSRSVNDLDQGAMMRIPLTITLFEKTAPEDHELQTSWDVQASANITWELATRERSGEFIAEDFRIEAVCSVWITYGVQGSVVVPLDRGSQLGQREGHRTLTWLQSQLPERDDWLALLTNQATQRAAEYLPHLSCRPGLGSPFAVYGAANRLRGCVVAR